VVRRAANYAEGVLKLAGLRLLDDRDMAGLQDLLAADPVANCFVAARVDAAGLAPWRLGAEIWGYGGSTLEAACYSGANLVPLGGGRAALRAFAERARRQGRRCSSVVGPAGSVLPLWDLLRPYWGRPREVRLRQPLLVIETDPPVPPDPLVRRVLPEQFDAVLPACIAMFTEEVGVSPIGTDGGTAYRQRVRDLIEEGRAYARFAGREVVFKAEIGAATKEACQVQGVWVHPRWRGRGLAAPGTAAVVRAALRDVAPSVSLYVNDFNHAARAAYRSCGFREVGTFATVLF
jgi:predicted GNAT family acetyltransferase